MRLHAGSSNGRSGYVAFEQMAEWTSAVQELPHAVEVNAKIGILDLLAVSIAARSEPIVDVLETVMPSDASRSRSTVVGRMMLGPPQFSAFANGVLAHALDFDDSSADLGGHPSAVVLPAALAAAQAVGACGRDLLKAYCVGVEVTCALGRALNPAHYDMGWHPTSTLGAFGATAAAGRLFGLSAGQLAQAFGLTSAFASGIKASFGTMAKPIQVGRAAMNGVAAAELVSAGATAASTAFEGAQGFLDTYQRTRSAEPVVLPGMDGQAWSLQMPGLIIKQYPCCGSTHSAIEAALGVRAQVGRPEDIESCEIRVHPKRVGHVNRPAPETALDCKFSLQYTVARTLITGGVRLEDFEQETPWDPRTRKLMERITVGVLDAGDERPEDRFVGEVSARTRSGDVRVLVPMASGRVPGEMLPGEAFREKFDACCARGLSPRRAGDLREKVSGIENLTTVDALVEACLPESEAPTAE